MATHLSFLPLLNDYYQHTYELAKAKHTPLLADGIDTVNRTPVCWTYPDGTQVPMSNFASQQNFMRGLMALSTITGKTSYRDCAIQTTNYFLKHYVEHVSGLFHWGGHRFINWQTGDIEGPASKECVHELKHHFPYYDLLYQIDPETTKQFLHGFWAAHVLDWGKLDLSRHGQYDKQPPKNVFRSYEPQLVVDPTQWPKLPETIGLTFVNASTDLIYAAYHYYKYTNDPNAEKWAKHLYHQFVLARHPRTRMPVYQFSSPLQREPIPDDDRITYSWFGDRAKRQFGQEFGPIAREANVLFRDTWPLIVDNPLAMLYCAKSTGDEELIDWIIEGIKAYFDYAWDEANNEIIPMWNSGQDMTGYVFRRDGYYGTKNTILKRQPADPAYLLTLVRASTLSNSISLRTLTSRMFARFGLGVLDTTTLNPIEVATTTCLASAYLVFALIELANLTQDDRLRILADQVGENLVRQHYHRGLFVRDARYRYARLDDPIPYALIALEAARKGCYDQIPTPLTTGGYLHGDQCINGEVKIVYDYDVIYNQQLDTIMPEAQCTKGESRDRTTVN
jgi:pectate disaccharide-lyase